MPHPYIIVPRIDTINKFNVVLQTLLSITLYKAWEIVYHIYQLHLKHLLRM